MKPRLSMALILGISILMVGAFRFGQYKPTHAEDDRLKGSYRFERNGWIYVHLEGSPGQIGYQHGSLLAKETDDLLRVLKPFLQHETKHDWNFYRQASQEILWPKIDAEFQTEIDGIVRGRRSMGHCGAQRARGTSLLLRAVAGQETGPRGDDARAGQLQRDGRDRQLHQRSSDRDGTQHVDRLCEGPALEHHL